MPNRLVTRRMQELAASFFLQIAVIRGGILHAAFMLTPGRRWLAILGRLVLHDGHVTQAVMAVNGERVHPYQRGRTRNTG